MIDSDDPIKNAMQAGQFDDLPGKGKPLNLDGNPFADPEWELAHHVLKSGGFTLPWIETRRQIEKEWRRADLKRPGTSAVGCCLELAPQMAAAAAKFTPSVKNL
jgi:DnaJ family protein C protein 28